MIGVWKTSNYKIKGGGIGGCVIGFVFYGYTCAGGGNSGNAFKTAFVTSAVINAVGFGVLVLRMVTLNFILQAVT